MIYLIHIEMKQQPRFDDFLKLDAVTMMDHFKIKEVKNLLKVEPYTKDTISDLTNLLNAFVEEEEYLWCVMLRDEINRRIELTVI